IPSASPCHGNILSEGVIRRMSIILSGPDQELLDRRFTVADPRSLSNLAERVPQDFKTAKLEFEYDIRPFVRCAHCNTPHGKGFVMQLQNGTRFLTGIDCGKSIYELDFHNIEREFRHGRARQYDLHRLLTCLPLLEPLSAALRDLSRDMRFR